MAEGHSPDWGPFPLFRSGRLAFLSLRTSANLTRSVLRAIRRSTLPPSACQWPFDGAAVVASRAGPPAPRGGDPGRRAPSAQSRGRGRRRGPMP